MVGVPQLCIIGYYIWLMNSYIASKTENVMADAEAGGTEMAANPAS